MNLSEIPQIRLANQLITHNNFANPEEVLTWMGAIQGQDYAGAKWSIGLRIPDSTDKTIEDSFQDNKIVRTWLMRGTLHMVAASDICWMTKLLSPRIIKSLAGRYRQLELDTETLLRSNEILTQALQREDCLNRKELLTILEQHGISTGGQRAPHLLQRACLDGLICQIDTNRNLANYILISNIASMPPRDKEEGLSELSKRFFTSRGPATLADFVWWSGLSVTDAKIGMNLIRDMFNREIIGDNEYWLPPRNDSPAEETSFEFLSGFDEFLLGYKDRLSALDPAHAQLWCPGNNGMFFPYILFNGRVVAIWKRSLKKRSLSIEVKPFAPIINHLHPLLMKAAEKYADFMEMKIGELTIR